MFTKVALMYEIELPQGVKAELRDGEIVVSGKLGSAMKVVNDRLVSISIEGSKVKVTPSTEKKLKKMAELAAHALSSQIKAAGEGVQNGIEVKMQSVTAHFPLTFEVKGDTLIVKNIFGERAPRSTKIVGATKLEIKGTDVRVKGVDPYDVGQTIANIRKVCKSAKGKDTRVFQDGLYVVREQ